MTFFLFPISSNIRSIQCAAHGDQNICVLFSINKFPADLYVASLSVTICTTFSSPISSTTLSIKLKIYLAFFISSEASIDLWYTVPKWQYTMKLIMLRLVGPVQPSHMIVHPLACHMGLKVFTYAFVSAYSASVHFPLISLAVGALIPSPASAAASITTCQYGEFAALGGMLACINNFAAALPSFSTEVLLHICFIFFCLLDSFLKRIGSTEGLLGTSSSSTSTSIG